VTSGQLLTDATGAMAPGGSPAVLSLKTLVKCGQSPKLTQWISDESRRIVMRKRKPGWDKTDSFKQNHPLFARL